MKKNLAYYAENARSFFDHTVDVDMASLHEAFLSKLAPDASILDAGCGSGRDARAFVQGGYDVTAFDASAPLARLASEHCGLDVAVRTFSEVSEMATTSPCWGLPSLVCCRSARQKIGVSPRSSAGPWRCVEPLASGPTSRP